MTTATTAQPARPSLAPAGSAPSGSAPAEYTHREILTALSGLLLAMFVAILSSTIVSNALPTIISDLHGSQTGYTWVVTATLLTTTVTTPIWGKLADLLNKKLLVQVAITIFILGSVGAGLSGSIESLIGWRAVQGIGAGGLQALAQVVIAVLIPPRQRGATPATWARCSRRPPSPARWSVGCWWTPRRWAGAGASSSACRSA